ncbi:ubiquinol-cytochrome c reductase cytochrome b subunit [Thermocatellispora tengchongensis]|uniref:Cytochrome bc1 complex cytochrome b subunit n=1 Tax=Thermocatellispora tengchongensis TaxID=1073253 RepID=A0A840P276_9ACTN|nr:cytochrome b N-terminal domain-containing protein [Thermocatellispora tengchongensis]MBB5135384.1 ubiquinol-cytochrome c reductase cytochrome b subunit [Thermocatellispora tengchongensis]
MRSLSARRRSFQFSHWSFMFAEIAVWSFAVLVVTGAVLMLFYDPGMSQVVYDGSYGPLRGLLVSRAFDSTMHLSLEVRGGLLIRQAHHWAALVFVAAVVLQLLRMFLTGAFRRPRTGQWLIWVTLLALGMAAGETGNALPDDSLSGGSLWLIMSVVQSIPVVGTWAMSLLFGPDFPGDRVIPVMYGGHLLIAAVMAALLIAREMLVRRHGHSRFIASLPARRSARPMMALATIGMLIVLGFGFQIAPIWLYGPAKPTQISAGSVPDWYMGFLDGALRIMPGWELTIADYTLSLAVLVPTLVVPGVFFAALAAYPMAERLLLARRDRRDALGRPKSTSRMTRETRAHDVLDRPRDTPVKTAIAVAGITFYGLLWAAAANDQIAHHFHLTVEAVTIFFRFAVVIGPVIAFVLTRRICLALQQADRHVAEHGVETGIITRSPDGGFHERLAPARQERREPAIPSGR